MITTYNDFITESKKYMDSFPDYYGIIDYKWNKGRLDCYQDVSIFNKKLTKLPFKFGVIDGDFNCCSNNLVDFTNFPTLVTGDLIFNTNKITSLVGIPKVDGDIQCFDNFITSLEGLPQKINRSLHCGNNKLTNLDYSPVEITGTFEFMACKITSLDNGPKMVGNNYWCSDNKLKSIEDYPLCIIENNITKIFNFDIIHQIVKENEEIFKPLLNNKIAFHQMVMRLRPDLIPEYTTIQPPSKKSILFSEL